MNITIYPAQRADAGDILALIIELAEYELARNQVVATREDIEKTLFGPDAHAEALICAIDGEPVGYAVFFMSYSTWLGKPGLYLEDLYVGKRFRQHGAGKALLTHVASIAKTRGCGRLEWSVLDWNKSAIDFYDSIGANALSEWIRYRLDERGIDHFLQQNGAA